MKNVWDCRKRKDSHVEKYLTHVGIYFSFCLAKNCLSPLVLFHFSFSYSSLVYALMFTFLLHAYQILL